MIKETEVFILKCNGIMNVGHNFPLNNHRIGKNILEIQYTQYRNNGTNSVYGEHVMRIGNIFFEVLGSKLSSARMAAVWKKLYLGMKYK
jgi:hypothetical protein